MANCLYNGVELPDINTVWTDKETYPYVIVEDISSLGIGATCAATFLQDKPFCAYGYILSNSEGVAPPSASATCKSATYLLLDGVWSLDDEYEGIGESTGAISGLASNVFWTSHNILNEDGSVYLAASDPVPVGGSKLKISVGGGNCLYNGVELPALPEIDGYPYATVCGGDISDLASALGLDINAPAWYLSVTDQKPYYAGSDSLGFSADWNSKNYMLVLDTDACAAINSALGQELIVPGEWVLAGENTGQSSTSHELAVPDLFWTNTDILNTDGSVYLAASDPVSTGGVTDTTATVSFSCSDLESTESVYQIKAWVYAPSGWSYNGVELPDINAVWTDKETYPYAVLTAMTGDYLAEQLTSLGMSNLIGTLDVAYSLRFVSSPYHYYNSDENRPRTMDSAYLKRYVFATGVVSEWTITFEASPSDTPDGGWYIPYSESLEMVWSSYDILNKDGSVYLAASEPTPGGLDTTTTPTYTSGVFAGPSHTESHTFEGLTPNTEYAVYGVIYANGEANGRDAAAAFITEAEVPSGPEPAFAPAYIGDADGIARQLECIYVGDADGIARKVLRAYVGNERGLASLWWDDSAEDV